MRPFRLPLFILVVATGVVGMSVVLKPTHATLAASRRAPMTEWYYADGIIQPESLSPRESRKGMWSTTREWMVIFNLSARETTVTATFYFEDLPPNEVIRKLPPRSSSSIVIHDIPDVVPLNKLYGVRIRSDAPVIVQPTRGENDHHNPITQAMASFIAYPGPLEQKETRWASADGVVLSSDDPEEFWEWITILNPNEDKASQAKITFYFQGGEKAIHKLTIPPQRVRTVDLYHLPNFPRNKVCGPVIESNVPIVVEQICRSSVRGIPVINAMWATMAYPIGDMQFED